MGWAPGAHDADIKSINQTELTHQQEAFRDLRVIIALYAVLSIQSTQQRPVCRDIYPSFYKGILFYSLLTLGTLSETQHCHQSISVFVLQ